MSKRCKRVSIWESKHKPAWSPEPATLVANDDHVKVKVSGRNWPSDLDTDDVIPGWQIVAHDSDGDLVYDGEIVDVTFNGTMAGSTYRLRCEPALTGHRQFPATQQPWANSSTSP